jgi:hypothetical protein
MISHRMPVATAAFAVTTILAAPASHAASFDGPWSVVVNTTSGHCGADRYGVIISGGVVQYAGSLPVNVAGRVSPSGHVRVAVGAPGPRYAQGSGRLSKNRGSGIWQGSGPSGTCSGVWSASRG